MRPIDTIKRGIDSDLIKYHPSTLYKIESNDDVKTFLGTGMCALVVPLDEYDDEKVKEQVLDPVDASKKFPVLILNRPDGWFEKDISSKYFVLVVSPVQDRGVMSAGFLINKTALRDIRAWENEIKKEDGSTIESLKEDYLVQKDGVESNGLFR